MCGIAGILNFERTAAAPAEVLERMLLSIFHRGPDDDGRLIDGELAMGMRRLSIIDLAEGQQPIFDESGRYAVVFNGEIYNYRELRQELLSRGHQLKTKSDTEVIVHLYEELGPNCLQHLRGMFGIAVKGDRKYLLKRVAERLLPSEIIHRKKQGFPIPIDRWLRNEARPLMRDMLSSDSLRRRGLFNPAVVEQLMQQHESGFADNTTELWGLVSFEMWMRRMVD